MSRPFIDKFSEVSGEYRRARPSYPKSLIAALAQLAPGRQLAWDSGTGNGQAAVALADHFEAVFATDPSPEQIAQAVPNERVTYAVEAAEEVSLPDGSVDLILSAQSLHWYDLGLFYEQVLRISRPGAILAAIGYAWQYISPEIDAIIEETLLQRMGSYWAPNNQLLWDNYRSIPFPGTDVRVSVPAIHLDWSLPELLDYVLTWSAARRLIAEQGSEPIRVARNRLEAVWGDPARPRHIVMPMQVRVSRIGQPD